MDKPSPRIALGCRNIRRIRPRHGRLVVESLEDRHMLSTTSVGSLASPLAVSAEIARRFDRDGNGVVSRKNVAIVGTTTPGATVTIDRGGDGTIEKTLQAGKTGRFAYRVSLPTGRTPFLVQARDELGSTASASVTATRGDVVIAWNQTMLNAIRKDVTGPPQATRAMAMVQLAVMDAVNTAMKTGDTYHFQGRAPKGTSAEAAATQAAYQVLASLYPRQIETFKLTRTEALRDSGRGGRMKGIRLGNAVARDMLALRANDGSNAAGIELSGTDAGDWVPTPPKYLPGLAPQWPNVTPFFMTSGSEFRPAPPPLLTSAEYAADYNEVKAIGGKVSAVRTADQTDIAEFWADVPGATFTPPGHWNQIAQDASLKTRTGLARNARVFAMLDAALADAAICCWDAKYAYALWRPVTAIAMGDSDGNPNTAGDPSWQPLWATPNFPSYTSGHSTFSGAAQTVLESAFGTSFAFSDIGDPVLKPKPRSFTSFKQAADEAGQSRIYGGIHYQFDNTAGLEGGRQIGKMVVGPVRTILTRKGRKGGHSEFFLNWDDFSVSKKLAMSPFFC